MQKSNNAIVKTRYTVDQNINKVMNVHVQQDEYSTVQ